MLTVEDKFTFQNKQKTKHFKIVTETLSKMFQILFLFVLKLVINKMQDFINYGEGDASKTKH